MGNIAERIKSIIEKDFYESGCCTSYGDVEQELLGKLFSFTLRTQLNLNNQIEQMLSEYENAYDSAIEDAGLLCKAVLKQKNDTFFFVYHKGFIDRSIIEDLIQRNMTVQVEGSEDQKISIAVNVDADVERSECVLITDKLLDEFEDWRKWMDGYHTLSHYDFDADDGMNYSKYNTYGFQSGIDDVEHGDSFSSYARDFFNLYGEELFDN